MNVEKIKTALWGAAGGAALTIAVGFFWGGWVTGGTALEMARQSADRAVVERLATICVDQFNRDPMKVEKFRTLQEEGSWKRREFVEKQGWATMPGEDAPANRVGSKCAELILQAAL